MSKKGFKAIESIVSMIVGVIIVTYTQDILLSIVFVIPIGIAYSLFLRFLKKTNKKVD